MMIMSMTATEKLRAVTQYVLNMAPVVRPAVLREPMDQAYANGYDQAMRDVQQDLIELLGKP